MASAQRKDKQNVIDLEKHVDKRIRVKFAGGREVVGVLKGFDQLVNVVLDDCTEYLPLPEGAPSSAQRQRYLGLLVCRGTNITVLCPEDGMREIDNPFRAAEE